MAPSINRRHLRALIDRWVGDPGARVLSRLGLTPNALTILGLLLSGGTAYLIASGRLMAAGALLLVAALFDLLDGALARLLDRATTFGALLDSVVDRLSEALVLLGVLVLALERGDTALSILAFLAFTSSVLVSYTRARAEGLGISADVGIMTRPERVLLLVIGLLAGQVAIALGVITALAFLTTLQRMLHAWRSLRRADGGPPG